MLWSCFTYSFYYSIEYQVVSGHDAVVGAVEYKVVIVEAGCPGNCGRVVSGRIVVIEQRRKASLKYSICGVLVALKAAAALNIASRAIPVKIILARFII